MVFYSLIIICISKGGTRLEEKLLSVLLIGGMVTTILTGCAGEAKRKKKIRK